MTRISVRVNGKQIPLNDFTRKIIESVIRGALKALHDVDPDGAIEISIPETDAASKKK